MRNENIYAPFLTFHHRGLALFLRGSMVLFLTTGSRTAPSCAFHRLMPWYTWSHSNWVEERTSSTFDSRELCLVSELCLDSELCLESDEVVRRTRVIADIV